MWLYFVTDVNSHRKRSLSQEAPEAPEAPDLESSCCVLDQHLGPSACQVGPSVAWFLWGEQNCLSFKKLGELLQYAEHMRKICWRYAELSQEHSLAVSHLFASSSAGFASQLKLQRIKHSWHTAHVEFMPDTGSRDLETFTVLNSVRVLSSKPGIRQLPASTEHGATVPTYIFPGRRSFTESFPGNRNNIVLAEWCQWCNHNFRINSTYIQVLAELMQRMEVMLTFERTWPSWKPQDMVPSVVVSRSSSSWRTSCTTQTYQRSVSRVRVGSWKGFEVLKI